MYPFQFEKRRQLSVGANKTEVSIAIAIVLASLRPVSGNDALQLAPYEA
jgi:hypothetical protein